MKQKMMITIIAFLLALLCACGSMEYAMESTEWTIYEKNYIPATAGTSGHWGYSFGDDGGLVYIGGSKGDPERYEFLLRRTDESGNIQTEAVDVSRDEYVTYEVGDVYTLQRWVWREKEETT